MAQAIAPETSAIQGETQQAKNQTAQFAPRSGGTAAWMAGLDANTRTQIIKLLGGLQSGAAGSLGSLGTSEQGLALSNRQAADQASQERLQNWQGSILGGGITNAISSAESYGLGKAEAPGGGGGGNGSVATGQGPMTDPGDFTDLGI